MTNLSQLGTLVAEIKAANAKLDIDDVTLEKVIVPERVVEINFSIQLDSGKPAIFKGFRVLHDSSRGPGKGGLRFHPELTLDTLKSLALDMTLKTALVDIPFGGAKGGVVCDPKRLSLAELERVTKRFALEISQFIGPNIDVPAPDVNTSSAVMSWFLDAIWTIKKAEQREIITGKPLELGGIEGHAGATANGLIYVLKAWAEEHKYNLPRKTVILQGLGKVGLPLLTLFESLGLRVIAVQDITGSYFNPKGFDSSRVSNHLKNAGDMLGFQYADSISEDEFWSLPADIVVPAALGGSITERVAKLIKASLILEAANSPTLKGAEDILINKGVNIIPDILANAGGVVYSYFEWAQDRQGYPWESSLIANRHRETMVNAFYRVLNVSKKHDVNLRTSSILVALESLTKAHKLRGNPL